MAIDEIPEIAGPAHGHMDCVDCLSHMQTASLQGMHIVVLLGLAVLLVALVDLVIGGRFRRIALILTAMLACLAPLIGLVAVAIDLTDAFGQLPFNGPDHDVLGLYVYPALYAGAASIAVVATVAAAAVVLHGILRLIPPRTKYRRPPN